MRGGMWSEQFGSRMARARRGRRNFKSGCMNSSEFYFEGGKIGVVFALARFIFAKIPAGLNFH